MKANFLPAHNIRTFAAQNPENLFKAIVFAVSTANCPLLPAVYTTRMVSDWVDTTGNVKTFAEITQAERSQGGNGLSRAKITTYTYLWVNREEIFAKYLECADLPNGYIVWWNYCMDCLSGMAVVKAAFCTQLVFGKMICVDTHNARELGIPVPTGKAQKTRAAYLELQNLKTSSRAWTDWCDFIAEKYPNTFHDGNTVSVLHEYAITGNLDLMEVC